jgi:hypothetical protein
MYKKYVLMCHKHVIYLYVLKITEKQEIVW